MTWNHQSRSGSSELLCLHVFPLIPLNYSCEGRYEVVSKSLKWLNLGSSCSPWSFPWEPAWRCCCCSRACRVEAGPHFVPSSGREPPHFLCWEAPSSALGLPLPSSTASFYCFSPSDAFLKNETAGPQAKNKSFLPQPSTISLKCCYFFFFLNWNRFRKSHYTSSGINKSRKIGRSCLGFELTEPCYILE